MHQRPDPHPELWTRPRGFRATEDPRVPRPRARHDCRVPRPRARHDVRVPHLRARQSAPPHRTGLAIPNKAIRVHSTTEHFDGCVKAGGGGGVAVAAAAAAAAQEVKAAWPASCRPIPSL
mmetsp:Transcript_34905/g.103431  ORF Transcript_34905/g.103431 Transcript_34905/m.103431 type:complete len:120 (+) Transcript_34905:1045-1404(+)